MPSGIEVLMLGGNGLPGDVVAPVVRRAVGVVIIMRRSSHRWCRPSWSYSRRSSSYHLAGDDARWRRTSPRSWCRLGSATSVKARLLSGVGAHDVGEETARIVAVVLVRVGLARDVELEHVTRAVGVVVGFRQS